MSARCTRESGHKDLKMGERCPACNLPSMGDMLGALGFSPAAGPQHSYAIGAGGGDDGCSACGAGQHEECTPDCSARGTPLMCGTVIGSPKSNDNRFCRLVAGHDGPHR